MEFHESAICDFRANANSVKPQPIAVLFKTMGAWAVLCFAADDTDARMAIGQEMEKSHYMAKRHSQYVPTSMLIREENLK